jgi:N6-adenosine-specific RNA methylase IME4
MNELGWEPNPLKILRADIPQYIDADKDIIELTLKISYQNEKVDFLEQAIRSLNSRGFNIKSAVEWEKFKVGI